MGFPIPTVDGVSLVDSAIQLGDVRKLNAINSVTLLNFITYSVTIFFAMM